MDGKGKGWPLASSGFVQVSQIKDSVGVSHPMLFHSPFSQGSIPDGMLPGIVDMMHVSAGIVPECFGPDGYLVGVVPRPVGFLVKGNHSGLKEEFLPGVLEDFVHLKVIFFVKGTLGDIHESPAKRIIARSEPQGGKGSATVGVSAHGGHFASLSSGKVETGVAAPKEVG